jgi:hypothetical protein
MQKTFSARQGGWSVFSFSIALAVAVLFFMVGLAMYPGYYEAFAIRKAINSLAEDASAGIMPKPTIWRLLEKRFDMSGLYSFTPTKDDLVVEFDKKTSKKRIAIEYDYKAPLFYNISIMMHFKHEILVEGS